MSYRPFYLDFEMSLYDAEDENLLTLNSWYQNILKEDNIPAVIPKIPKKYIELCKKSNGFEINWKATHIENTYGKVEFLDFDTVTGSWEGQVYEPEDLKINELLEFYHPFDMVAPEFSCGFILDPEVGTWKSIQVHTWGERETHSLDIDFDGYITMLYESRAYANWPKILLNIQNENLESDLITDFKVKMPKLFPDFDWSNYLEKYESLRLSKKIKST